MPKRKLCRLRCTWTCSIRRRMWDRQPSPRSTTCLKSFWPFRGDTTDRCPGRMERAVCLCGRQPDVGVHSGPLCAGRSQRQRKGGRNTLSASRGKVDDEWLGFDGQKCRHGHQRKPRRQFMQRFEEDDDDSPILEFNKNFFLPASTR